MALVLVHEERMGDRFCSHESHIHLDVVARTAKSIKGYINKGLKPGMREVIVSLYSEMA